MYPTYYSYCLEMAMARPRICIKTQLNKAFHEFADYTRELVHVIISGRPGVTATLERVFRAASDLGTILGDVETADFFKALIDNSVGITRGKVKQDATAVSDSQHQWEMRSDQLIAHWKSKYATMSTTALKTVFSAYLDSLIKEIDASIQASKPGSESKWAAESIAAHDRGVAALYTMGVMLWDTIAPTIA